MLRCAATVLGTQRYFRPDLTRIFLLARLCILSYLVLFGAFCPIFIAKQAFLACFGVGLDKKHPSEPDIQKAWSTTEEHELTQPRSRQIRKAEPSQDK